MKLISRISLLCLAGLAAMGGRWLAAAPVERPASITDPQLLAAWGRVYQQQQPIEFAGGGPVSGRSLALFLREHAIPVVWDVTGACGGSSCSLISCVGARCTYPSPPGQVAPIYIRPGERGDLRALTSTLAHEIFHRTQPFGPVEDTRYEEFLAFQIGGVVAHTPWPSFAGYHALDPDQLNVWFQANHMLEYLSFPEYPAAVLPLVYHAAGGGDPYSGIPAQAYETPGLP
jgi:hypothetical protein